MTTSTKTVPEVWRKAASALRRQLKPAMRQHQLTKMDNKIMMAIKRNISCSKAELAQLVLCEPASLTRSLNRLVEQGVIQRLENSDDKRFVRLTLTDKGEAVAKSYKRAVVAVWKQALCDVSPRDVEVFLSVLEKMTDNLDNG